MVEKIYTVHKDDAKHRPQRNDNRPRNIAELQRRSGTPDQRFTDNKQISYETIRLNF